MNPSSQDISAMLEAESSLGLTYGTNLFIGKEPSKSKSCTTIFDTPGAPPQLTIAGDENYFYPSIQIRVRNVKYTDGWDLANNIRTALHGRGHETWNGTNYSLIKCTNGPFLLDWDEDNNFRIILNFDIQRN